MSVAKCVVPECGSRLSAEMAFVPELFAIRAKIGKNKPITVAELSNHTLCPRHNRLFRELMESEGKKVRTFRYLDTVKVIEKRAEAREKDAKFFSMYAAFQKAEVGSPPADKPKGGLNEGVVHESAIDSCPFPSRFK